MLVFIKKRRLTVLPAGLGREKLFFTLQFPLSFDNLVRRVCIFKIYLFL